MKQIETRLEELEARRPVFGLPVEQMSDAELIGVITGTRSTVITDQQLARMAQGETWADVTNGLTGGGT